jgi:proteasome lid subunit RPN8/RPN11
MGKDEKDEKTQDINEKLGVRILSSFEHDFGDVESKPFPGGSFRPFGNEFRVCFTRKTYDDIIDHSFLDDKIELGGVLIGELRKDEYGAYLFVIGIIRGKYSASTTSQFTFTHETWNYINSIKDKEFPEKKIVGWYHTHPKFGIFLSEMDLFIHENYFSQPYLIAFVTDPVNKSEGCFVKTEKGISLIKRFWVDKTEHLSTQDKSERELIMDKLQELEKIVRAGGGEKAGEENRKDGSLMGFVGWVAALLLLVVLLFQTFFRKSDTLDSSLRANEVLIGTQVDEKQGIQLRLYAAPVSKDQMIQLPYPREGTLNRDILRGAESPSPGESPAKKQGGILKKSNTSNDSVPSPSGE